QEPLNSFLVLTDSYQQKFNQLVAMQQRLGLDPKSGLIGELRQTVQQLEDRLDLLEKDQLIILVLQLRRAEKDFLLRKELAYVDKFASTMALLLQQLAGDNVST